jgi:hypothetical protein
MKDVQPFFLIPEQEYPTKIIHKKSGLLSRLLFGKSKMQNFPFRGFVSDSKVRLKS